MDLVPTRSHASPSVDCSDNLQCNLPTLFAPVESRSGIVSNESAAAGQDSAQSYSQNIACKPERPGAFNSRFPYDAVASHSDKSGGEQEQSNAAVNGLGIMSDVNVNGTSQTSKFSNQEYEGPNNADLLADLEVTDESSISTDRKLTDELVSLQDALSQKERTRVLLQKEVDKNRKTIEALNDAISFVEAKNKEHSDTAAQLMQEVQEMHGDKVCLQNQKLKIAAENERLGTRYAEAKRNISNISSDSDGKKAAIAASQAYVHMSCFDLEWFHLEKSEYLKEINTLEVSNDFLNVQVARLAEDEKILSNEIQNVMAVKLSADQRISDLEVKVAALGNELLMLIENGKLLPNQLEEANTRLRYLQDVHTAMDLREKDILANIKVLEDQLYTLRSNFEVTCQAAENDKSKLDNIGASEVVYGQVVASGRDLPTLESSGEIQDYDAAPDVARQQIESIDIRAPNVCINTQVYSCMDKVLKSVRMEQHEKEMVSSSQLMEDIKKLQDAFNESEQRAQTLRKREAELKMKLQELMNKKSKSVSLSVPLIISGGTIFMVGLLVLLWRTRSNPN